MKTHKVRKPQKNETNPLLPSLDCRVNWNKVYLCERRVACCDDKEARRLRKREVVKSLFVCNVEQ